MPINQTTISPLSYDQSPMGAFNAAYGSMARSQLTNQLMRQQQAKAMYAQQMAQQALAQQQQATQQSNIRTQAAKNVLAFQNPLLEEQLAQQTSTSGILGAEAQYAPSYQSGRAAEQIGLGGTAETQARFAPGYYGGQAAIQQGLGSQEQAAGYYSMPQNLAQLQQQQQAAKQAGITTQYMPKTIQAGMAATTLPAYNQMFHNLIAMGASPQLAQEFINQASSVGKINPNAPNIPINPMGWTKGNSKLNIPIGSVKKIGKGAYKFDGTGWIPQ